MLSRHDGCHCCLNHYLRGCDLLFVCMEQKNVHEVQGTSLAPRAYCARSCAFEYVDCDDLVHRCAFLGLSPNNAASDILGVGSDHSDFHGDAVVVEADAAVVVVAVGCCSLSNVHGPALMKLK